MCSKVDPPREAPLKKTSTIWKNYKYLCNKKSDNNGLPQKNCQGGGGQDQKCPLTTYEERNPPHGENGPPRGEKRLPT